ncbi:amidohydrolase [Clostridiaceae bacterium 35-E11]
MMYTLIKGGNIFDVNKGYYVEGDLLIHNGKIERIGQGINEVKIDQVIHGYGKKIFPGFIDAHSHIGMWTYTHNGNDANECVSPITPQMRAIDGINPQDPCFQEAVEAGITTVMATPGSGNVIGGMATILKTKGTTVSKMIIKEYAALKIALGENPKNVYHAIGKTPSSRMATAALLEEHFTKAQMYFRKKQKGLVEEDERWEVFVPVLKKEIPLKIHAHRADDILTAIRIAEKFDLCYTLDHCTEGYRIVDALKSKNAPILLGPLFMFKTKQELKNGSLKSAEILSDAGCELSIISDHPFANSRYLLSFVGLLVKEGLDYAQAIRMITINPAKALGIEKSVGSLEEGKDADIVLCDGDPLEIQTKVCMTMIDGKIVHTADY